jgi:Fur family zinc uptake transcriptional regulator
MTLPQSKAFARHNHKKCCGDALAMADSLAQGAGIRLTPVRRKALEILLQEHQALGAYEVLDRLAESGFARQPPVAYRALEFLVEHGLAHRVQQLNAFAACMSPGQSHAPAFLICSMCKMVAELPGETLCGEVESAAQTMGFEIEKTSIEVVGVCPSCRDRAPAAP